MIESIHEIRVRSAHGQIKVRITGRAITLLRSKGSQSLPAFVIAEQRDTIERAAIAKFQTGTFDKEGFVLIDEIDL